MIKLHENRVIEINEKTFSLIDDTNDYVISWLEDLPNTYSKTTLNDLTTDDVQREIDEMKYEREHGIYTIVNDDFDNGGYFEALELYIEILETIRNEI